ncbi:patatin-like phospholipase family protein [Thalassotalea marina]|uniref:Patatin n=1 Tax=Thalassotalea marina TaxID=1673741 RepID=A0A919BS84_9GAMM|nr:patatin-like phospholipase family protein [Thalassotalea marina]GHG06646.1 patatin [Thalassotalea marina]
MTGGGARAAYQVGVLSAISKFYPRHYPLPFPVICGTSAGAINSTALACYASCFQLGTKKLEWVWKNLTTERIYHSDPIRVFGHIFRGFLAGFQADYASKTARSLLNNTPLRQLLGEVLDFKRIDTNIINGYLNALSITTSSYTTGDSISYYQSDALIPPWFRAKRRGVPSHITFEHLMASSAIPMIFPSVRIRNEHLGDGSIHQLSPLSPAIHLGGEKLFVIGVTQPKDKLHLHENNPHPPTTSTIAGHLLDGIFADSLQSDLERLNRVNQTLSMIPADQKRQEGLKPIETFVINPSQDFNTIAVEHYSRLPLAIRMLFRSIGITNDAESSFISYLLFDHSYCKELINVGYMDAMNQEQKIREFLSS